MGLLYLYGGWSGLTHNGNTDQTDRVPDACLTLTELGILLAHVFYGQCDLKL